MACRARRTPRSGVAKRLDDVYLNVKTTPVHSDAVLTEAVPVYMNLNQLNFSVRVDAHGGVGNI